MGLLVTCRGNAASLKLCSWSIFAVIWGLAARMLLLLCWLRHCTSCGLLSLRRFVGPLRLMSEMLHFCMHHLVVRIGGALQTLNLPLLRTAVNKCGVTLGCPWLVGNRYGIYNFPLQMMSDCDEKEFVFHDGGSPADDLQM